MCYKQKCKVVSLNLAHPVGNSGHCVLDISCDCNEYSRINSSEKFNFEKGNSLLQLAQGFKMVLFKGEYLKNGAFERDEDANRKP